MEKIFTEDEYIRCDIVTGRLYRCLTSLFQEFIDIQFTEVWGEHWINNIVKLADEMPKNTSYSPKNLSDTIKGREKRIQIDWTTEKTKLSALKKKRDSSALEIMDKSAIDVTIASTLMQYTCFFVLAVPRYKGISNIDMIKILCEQTQTAESDYDKNDTEGLYGKVLDCIKADATAVLKCQARMGKWNKEKWNSAEREKGAWEKSGSISDESFFKLVKNLVDNKNNLNSHMSNVNDSIFSKQEISSMIVNLKGLLRYLEVTWEYREKDVFISKYKKEVALIQYLFETPEMKTVIDAVCTVAAAMPTEKNDDSNNEISDFHYDETYVRGFSLLSNINNHCAAYTALTAASGSLENPCASIMLAFMYYCGWTSGHSADEMLMTISVVSDPGEWLAKAEELKASKREQATAYYIGHAMVNNAPSAFKMAGYLGVRLENYEIAKACFRYAGETDKTAKTYYEGLSAMQDEASFRKWAIEQNKKR